MKKSIKKIIKSLPIAFTRNQRYDRQAQQVLKRELRVDSNCIDVGCHEGEFMQIINKLSPEGYHMGFEPLPDLYKELKNSFPRNCQFFNVALSNKKGQSAFNYVVTNPAYSGLLRRRYDNPKERDQKIRVQTDILDNYVNKNHPVDFIKIDVEGAELQVLEGARQTIRQRRPFIIFEHGKGAADIYGTHPADVFNFFKELHYGIWLMDQYLKNGSVLKIEQFERYFQKGIHWYFLAYPD